MSLKVTEVGDDMIRIEVSVGRWRASPKGGTYRERKSQRFYVAINASNLEVNGPQAEAGMRVNTAISELLGLK